MNQTLYDYTLHYPYHTQVGGSQEARDTLPDQSGKNLPCVICSQGARLVALGVCFPSGQ